MINHGFNKVKMADSSEIDLYAAFPERQGDFPAVILLQETFGIPEHLQCTLSLTLQLRNFLPAIQGRNECYNKEWK